MIHKKQIGKETDANTSIYEAVGKMLLGNVTAGRMVNPATLGLIDKALKTGQDSEYEELLEKPLWQFTGKDHEYMLKHVLMESFTSVDAEPSSQKRYVQGYQGIATLFGCSKSTRKILVDADLALQLVKESGCKMNEL